MHLGDAVCLKNWLSLNFYNYQEERDRTGTVLIFLWVNTGWKKKINIEVTQYNRAEPLLGSTHRAGETLLSSEGMADWVVSPRFVLEGDLWKRNVRGKQLIGAGN